MFDLKNPVSLYFFWIIKSPPGFIFGATDNINFPIIECGEGVCVLVAINSKQFEATQSFGNDFSLLAEPLSRRKEGKPT